MILKLGMLHWRLKLYKVYMNNDPGLILTYFFVLYLQEAQISGEPLQDHWSSGLDYIKFAFASALICFRYIDSTIPLLSKSEISSL